MKKLLALVLTLVMAFSTACAQSWWSGWSDIDYYYDTPYYDGCFNDWIAEADELPFVEEDGWYYSVEDVTFYLLYYGWLPENFITKADARSLGWSGGSVEYYLEGAAIGGDRFGNREGLLPSAKGRVYYECDIDTFEKDSRGAERLVFSSDGLIYYTMDHYESFVLLYEGLD